jgi:hypothetical protein
MLADNKLKFAAKKDLTTALLILTYLYVEILSKKEETCKTRKELESFLAVAVG